LLNGEHLNDDFSSVEEVEDENFNTKDYETADSVI